MPAKKNPSAALTQREHDIMTAWFKCLKGKPEIDQKRFQELAGFTNPKSGDNALATIKKKLAAASDGDDNEADPGTAPAKNAARRKSAPASTGRKRKTAEVAAKDIKDEDEGSGEETAALLPHKEPAKKRTKHTPADSHAEEDGEATEFKEEFDDGEM